MVSESPIVAQGFALGITMAGGVFFMEHLVPCALIVTQICQHYLFTFTFLLSWRCLLVTIELGFN